MNILYVNAGNAGSVGLDSFLSSPPIALMAISPTISPDHKKYLMDLKVREFPDKTIRRLIQKADVVAISSYTPSIKSAMRIGNIAKEFGKPVIIGGYHASLVPETVKEPMFDVSVQNEGELSFPLLIDILEKDGKFSTETLKDVKGISYMKNGDLITNEKQPIIQDLDTLPFPDRTLIGNTKYEYFGATVDLIESSRGCVGKCNFCCVKKHCRGVWRKKSPERTVAEIGKCNRNAKWIGFQDSEFTINMDRVEKICDLIIDNGYENQWYSAQARADDIVRKPEIFNKMVKAGWKMLFLGIESAHQKSLDRIGKKMTKETIKKAVEMCHDNGVTVMGAIIIGNIGETYDEVLETIKLASKYEIDIAQFTALTPLPGTELWDEAHEKGWIEDYDWTHYDFVRPVMHTPDLTREQINELVHKAYNDFYIGDVWGSYFWKRAPRFFGNRNHWWFFKMLPGFLKNIPSIEKFVTDISKTPELDG
ncbi:MAG: B12-binding domain-containing radical SAM protein [Candidatus Hodarchaeota archaeon]